MRKSVWLCAVLLIGLLSRGAAASYVEGEALVVFKKAPGAAVTAASVERGSESFRLASLAAASGARVAQAYGALSEAGDGVFALIRSETRTAEQLVEDLKARADVVAASPNYITRAMRTPNDPRYVSGDLWGLSAIRAPEAWEVTTGSTDVYVVVADSGIYAAHEDLKANLAAELCRNFTRIDEKTPAVPSDYSDADGHGTHVAGTIGAVGNNGLGVAGVNWTTRLIALRVMGADGFGADSWTVEALNHLVSLLRSHPQMKVAAINLSLGSYGSPAPAAMQAGPYWMAYKVLDDLDRTVIVVAAGNEGLEVGKPAPYDEPGPEDPQNPFYRKGDYGYPASFTGLKNLIVVAAASADATAASFSNWSPTAVHLAAPGVRILSTITPRSNGDIYMNLEGTSMAAPHVAGAAALLVSRYPNATASQIRDALLKGADKSRNPVATARTNTGGAKLSRYGYLDVKKALDILEAASPDLGPKPEPNPQPSPSPQPEPNPQPGPNPQPEPNPQPGEDLVVPTQPSRWTIVRGTSDAQGVIPVTLTVFITARKALASIEVETAAMAEVSVYKSGGAASRSSDALSASAPSYTITITGKVAKSQWADAAVKALRYRLEGETESKMRLLGDGGRGVFLSKMADRTPLLPDPGPNRGSRSSGGGCAAGLGGLALLALVPLAVRRWR